MSHQRFSYGEQLREIDDQIVAMGGGHEFMGVEWPTPDTPKYLFANADPMIGHANALAYMQERLRDAEKASLEQD
jgi:hypothetical protein